MNILFMFFNGFLFCYLLQGVDEGPEGLKLISDVIKEKLGITMTVLMGANLANEVADGKFCETTIGKCAGNIAFVQENISGCAVK